MGVMTTLAVILLSIVGGGALGASIWETQAFEITRKPIVHLVSYNFTNGGTFALSLQAVVYPGSATGVGLVVCDAAAYSTMLSLGYPDASWPLCMKRSRKSSATVLQSLCAVYPMLGTLSSILQSNWSAPSETILFARIDLTDDIPSTSAGMHHMLIDACSIACASSDDCEDDGSTQISATLRYAMCDAASPRQCAGNHMNQLVVIYTTYAVLWVLAGIVWAGHTYRSRAPVFKLHVIMSLTLATKVIATGTASLAFLVSRMDATLAYLRLAEIMQLGVTCLMMLVVFGLSDGCDIVGVHDRGFLLAILYFGYSLVESADSWNPILSAVMVLCILFMITTLSTKRLNELHTYAYALQQAGLNPDASPLGTKVRLLRAARLFSVLYFLETYCIKIVFFLVHPTTTVAEDAMVEGLQLVFFLLMGYTFRCRHFSYVLTYTPRPRPSARVVPIANSPEGIEATSLVPLVVPIIMKATVFSHPDNSRSLGKPCEGLLNHREP
ncbi:hypothetical protein AaE_015100 [Aphanomyces astaci]|uniref:TRP C-terminal domain-containing protein n=1 Tax=Aphanomyces astaci TaxID=112090 RepID=A0A6A4YYV2_APHAT|nr:hypothetical protein AaE_015100 [Aphanomyces astaci]